MGKRELPTRHNFLTEAVKTLLEPEISPQEPCIDSKSIITVTTDPKLLDHYQRHDPPEPIPTPPIEQIPRVTRIQPIARMTKKQLDEFVFDQDDDLSDDYYLKRHRRHEKEEKTQKNREKERLKHGYYQQKQLVERIKTMEKSLLQSIVSSIRHRTHYEGGQEEEDEYLNDLHCRLLNDAVEHLKRYEVLGLGNEKMMEESATTAAPVTNSVSPAITPEENTFQNALKTEAIKQRNRQIKSFSNQPVFAGNESIRKNTRKSHRHVLAFGQRVPDILEEVYEFSLPKEILQWKA